MKKILFVLMLSSLAVLGKAQTIEEGIKQMENENFAAALNTFNSICKADPKASLAHFYIGEVNYLMENNAEAEKSYKKGLTVNQQCAECNVGLGKLELDAAKSSNRKYVDEYMDLVKKANTASDMIQLHKLEEELQTEIERIKGILASAEKNFSTAIRIQKKNPFIYGLIGDAYLFSKYPDTKERAEKAIKYLSIARDMNPKEARFWAHLGDAYKMSSDNGEAMTSYEEAVRKDPSNAEAYISMARIWANAKQVDLAIPKLEEAIRLSPNDARPIKDLYELYIQTRNYEKVTPLLEKYVELTGTDVDAKVRLVKFLTFQAKDYERAVIEGEKILLTNPEQYTLHRWLAWAYAELGKYKESYSHSDQLFDALGKKEDRKAFPSDYEYWAKAAFQLGNLEEAAHIYRKYLEFEPSRASEIYGLLAKTYFDSTNYEQAIAYYKRKGEIKPLSNADEYYLGLSYYYADHNLEADSSFVKVLAATPNYPQGWLMRARIGNQIDSTRTEFLAKPYYEKYIEFASVDKVKNKNNLIEAYNFMAYYWVQQEDNTKAKEFYEMILELDPANEVAMENLKILKGQK